MPNWIKAAWQDVVSGIDLELYFVLILTIGVLLYHVLIRPILGSGADASWSSEVITSATLIALGSLGVGLLGDRKERRLLHDSLRSLITPPSPGQVLVRWSEHSAQFRERLSRARTFSLLVRTPDRTVQRYELQISSMLQRRQARVRILCVEPDSDAMRLLCRVDTRYIDMIKVFLDHTLPALARSIASADQIEVRATNSLPTCLLALIDEDQPDAEIFATIVSSLQPGDLRPSLRITRSDAALFDFFRAEYQQLWNAAHQVLSLAHHSDAVDTYAEPAPERLP